MTETRDVNADPEGEDLIPKEQLPTDPVELAKEPTESAEEPVDEPAADGSVPETSPGTPEKKPEDHSQPAPVVGETPREKALRLEIQRLRNLHRKDSVKELIDAKPQVTSEDEYQVLRDQGYSDEQIKSMETAIDVIASKKGYVRADRSYAQSVQDTVDLFTESHSEYLPTNDVDDVRWNMFQSYLKDGTYNLSGKTPKQLTAIFDKVNADVKKQLGEVSIQSNPRQLAAQQHKVQVVSHAGGTKSVQVEKAKVNPTHVGGIKLVGFDEDDFT